MELQTHGVSQIRVALPTPEAQPIREARSIHAAMPGTTIGGTVHALPRWCSPGWR